MLKFSRTNNVGVHITADDIGVWISTDVWTVPVQKDIAKRYADDYLNPTVANQVNIGFFDYQGKVVFTHDNAKMVFSVQEAKDVIDLIKTTYP